MVRRSPRFFSTQKDDTKRIGEAFQADVPSFSSSQPCLEDSREEALWIPEKDDSKAQRLRERLGLPPATRFAHDEQLLLALFKADYNVDRAMRHFHDVKHATSTPKKTFTSEELATFAKALKLKRFRKDFFRIQKDFLPRFTVRELVELYYSLKHMDPWRKATKT
uniref:ELM2 domain-containing protein n=1 Tax=Steinernema glaseri TaxID=37863 RepID=A0A1I7YE97_9BILA